MVLCLQWLFQRITNKGKCPNSYRKINLKSVMNPKCKCWSYKTSRRICNRKHLWPWSRQIFFFKQGTHKVWVSKKVGFSKGKHACSLKGTAAKETEKQGADRGQVFAQLTPDKGIICRINEKLRQLIAMKTQPLSKMMWRLGPRLLQGRCKTKISPWKDSPCH